MSDKQERLLERLIWVLFGMLLLAQAVFLLGGPLYPTADGPAHLYTAKLLLESGKHQDLLEWNEWFLPQGVAQWLLAAKVGTLGLDVGYRVYLVLVSLALPLLVALLTRRGDAALLAQSLSLGFVFTMGFFPYVLSVALALGVVLLHERWKGVVTPGRAGLLAVLLVITYFTHVVGFALAAGVLSVMALMRLREQRPWLTWAACVPGFLLLALYVGAAEKASYVEAGGPLGAGEIWGHVTQHAFRAISTDRWHSLLKNAYFLVFGVAVAVALWARRKERRVEASDVLLAGFLCPVVAPLLPDGGAGGSYLQTRVAQLGPLLVLVWFAMQRLRVLERAGIAVLASTLCIGMLATRYQLARWWAPYQSEVVETAGRLPKGATIVALPVWASGFDDEGREEKLRFLPMDHMDGWISAKADAFNLYNYQAASGTFPERFREQVSPDVALFGGHPPQRPAVMDLFRYRALPGREIQRIALIVPAARGRKHANTGQLAEQMREWELEFRSPKGLVEIYRKKDKATESGTESRP